MSCIQSTKSGGKTEHELLETNLALNKQQATNITQNVLFLFLCKHLPCGAPTLEIAYWQWKLWKQLRGFWPVTMQSLTLHF